MTSDVWVVSMPKLGETVTEGEVGTWFKQVGDTVELDDPLFEVSTDKVDSEIPSPYDGVIVEILVQSGETVPVGHAAGPDRPAGQPGAAARAGGAAAAATRRPPRTRGRARTPPRRRSAARRARRPRRRRSRSPARCTS